jgi:hypothetical protein
MISVTRDVNFHYRGILLQSLQESKDFLGVKECELRVDLSMKSDQAFANSVSYSYLVYSVTKFIGENRILFKHLAARIF